MASRAWRANRSVLSYRRARAAGTSSNRALGGAMVGACTGLAALPAAAVRKVREVNGLELEPLVERLLALRSR